MDAVACNQLKARVTRSERMHVAKVILWPFTGDTKATAVRPRVGERDVLAAKQLMHRAQVAA